MGDDQVRELWDVLRQIQVDVAKLGTKLEERPRPCETLATHIREHGESESRRWGLGMRLISTAFAAAIGALLALFGFGN